MGCLRPSAKETYYGGMCHPTFNLIPFALFTCGDYSSSTQDLVMALGKMNAEAAEGFLEATGHGKQ